MGNLNPERPPDQGRRPRSTPSAHPMGDIGSMRDIIRRIDRAHEASKRKAPEETHILLERRPFTDEGPKPETQDPLQIAQELMKEASRASGARRAELARRALQVSQDCAEAYVILAEETARSLESARSLYEAGVNAGERALGEAFFRGNSDKSRSSASAQSYIRARTGLARCLWSLGRRQEAIGHCAEMLQLDPSDSQGTRYLLANWLLHEKFQEGLADLFEAFRDDKETSWLYTRALWAFGQRGACDKADEYLKEALRQNPYVPSYLLGLKKMPGILPEGGESGDEREAISYIAEALDTWLQTDGALEWLIMTLPRVMQRTRTGSP